MHIVILLIYGLTFWLSTAAYALIVGGSLQAIILGGPVIISGSIAALIVLDQLVRRLVR